MQVCTKAAAKKLGLGVDALLISDNGTPWLPTTIRQLLAASQRGEVTFKTHGIG